MTTNKWISGIALGAVAFGLASAASAGDVTLKMRGGEFSFAGALKSFDGNRYTLTSPKFGTMTLEAARFECVSGDCPRGPQTATAATASLASVARSDDAASVALAGSNTIGNQLMPALIEGYAKSIGARMTKIVGADPLDVEFKLANSDNRESLISLHRHGSTTAFVELEKKAVQIGMASRPIKAEEAQHLQAAGLQDLRRPGSEHILGLDGLLVLVAPGSKAISLPIETIAEIFSGKIADWSEVGLPAGKINVYAPTKESGTFETFDTLVLQPRKLQLTPTAKRTENHAEQSDLVAHDPNGIGFTGVAYLGNSKALNIESRCGLIAVPTLFSMKTEEYPLTRRLFLYTDGEPREPLARGLLNYALAPAAQTIVKQNDFVDQLPERAAYSEQAARIANAVNAPAEAFDLPLMNGLIADLKSAERLSITFRFQTGSDVLDNKALADVGRLKDLLAQQEFKRAQVYLVGFADSVGRFDNNLRLSQRRAQAVLGAINAAGGVSNTGFGGTLAVKAYSALAPVSCNDAVEGRQLNRRVEVWLKR